ncbi:hypothetical protein KUTeg_012913 [Tegillarca granosa]|uniref:Uncharacterized protein n=1 Tax=Tegillarca granosa TaxID=220873 RepID=A0ABQ9ESL5_TEGGR|nr:hypothetical protein KUTeg_012913 [Tegillarca granosa]
MCTFPLLSMYKLYISEENVEAKELDFKKALDLLQYIDQSDPTVDYNALRLLIWTKAALRDSWLPDPSGDPQNAIKDTVFFKTVDLAFNEGWNIMQYLPDLGDLLQADDLGPLKEDRNFQYLMSAGYEHIKQVLNP